jgi:CRISPR-associated protein Cas6/Cse3/CasE subtype I-E
MSSLVPQATDLATVKLHLTQILVGYEDAVRLLKIRDTYDWHQRVWETFRGRDGEARDFLVRVDRKEEAYRLLILSRSVPRKPDWCPTDCFGTKTIADDYFHHTRYRFSLLANPTRKLRVNNPDGTRKKNGLRAPIVKREELIAWLQRRQRRAALPWIQIRCRPSRADASFSTNPELTELSTPSNSRASSLCATPRSFAPPSPQASARQKPLALACSHSRRFRKSKPQPSNPSHTRRPCI